MPYAIGIVLSLSVARFASRVGFDRDRAFYPTVLIVIASYYVLWAIFLAAILSVCELRSIVATFFSRNVRDKQPAGTAGYPISA